MIGNHLERYSRSLENNLKGEPARLGENILAGGADVRPEHHSLTLTIAGESAVSSRRTARSRVFAEICPPLFLRPDKLITCRLSAVRRDS